MNCNLVFGLNIPQTIILIDITESVKSALDNKIHACGIFVDLQKAFDTVNNKILLDKHSHFGVRGIANYQFSSYLSNRNQYVSILGFDYKIMAVLFLVLFCP